MSGDPTDIHTDDAHAPSVTYRYARCQVCGAQWQIRSEAGIDAQGCAFCHAPASAVETLSEEE